jgi:hypothetical protein
MVSQHANSRVYHKFLAKVSEAVKARAIALVDGTAKSTLSPEVEQRLLENARIISEDGFVPPFVMIDGDKAELKAINRMWPGLPKRVCQFHLIQAVRNCCRSLYGRSIAGEIKTQETLEAFRECQRCPDPSEWGRYYAELEDKVNIIATDDGAIWRRFDEYLKRVWFNEFWRAMCVDFGLPSDVFRDGAWSTNNLVEATFRIFDRVLLCGRANKRYVTGQD